MAKRDACESCGHVHAGVDLAFICIGCPCEERPAPIRLRTTVDDPAMRDLVIKMRFGDAIVVAYIVGDWAAHPRITIGEEGLYPDDSWSVTHVPTGLGLERTQSGDFCESMCRRIVDRLAVEVPGDVEAVKPRKADVRRILDEEFAR